MISANQILTCSEQPCTRTLMAQPIKDLSIQTVLEQSTTKSELATRARESY